MLLILCRWRCACCLLLLFLCTQKSSNLSPRSHLFRRSLNSFLLSAARCFSSSLFSLSPSKFFTELTHSKIPTNRWNSVEKRLDPATLSTHHTKHTTQTLKLDICRPTEAVESSSSSSIYVCCMLLAWTRGYKVTENIHTLYIEIFHNKNINFLDLNFYNFIWILYQKKISKFLQI